MTTAIPAFLLPLICGLLIGLAALAVFVALANALVYRDRGFGAYAIYVLAMILGQAGITGVGGMLFWPEMPALNNPMTFFMPLLAGALGVWFVRIVATPQQYSTLLDRLAVSIILGLIAVAGAKIWVDNKVDFSQNKNLIVAAITLILGTGDFTLKFGGFALGIQAIELLLQTLFGTLSCVDGAPDGRLCTAAVHEPTAAALPLIWPLRPKNLGPFQRVPVMA